MTGFGRREFVVGMAATGLAGCTPCCRLPELGAWPALLTTPFAIDAHCHVFNLSDLPASKFVERTQLHVSKQSGVSPFVPLVEAVAEILTDRAPTAAEELNCLSLIQDAPPGLLARLTAGSAPAVTADRPGDIEQAVQEALYRELRRPGALAEKGAHAEGLWNDRRECVAPNHAAASTGGRSHLSPTTPSKPLWLTKLGQRYRHGDPELKTEEGYRNLIPDIATRIIHNDPIKPPNGTSHAEGLEDVPAKVATLINWVWDLTDYRYRHVERLVQLSNFPDRRLRLIVPALVDYQVPLGSEPLHTKLVEQSMVMERLSMLQPGGCAVHGYAAFDPFRDIGLGGFTEGVSLQFVKDCVENRGFLGVKLYPPMGFRPINNAVGYRPYLPPDFSDLTSAQLEKLDSSLWTLYRWCSDKDVPILVHCSDSEEAGPSTGLDADPLNWKAVLERYPRLRLNLGHFASIWAEKCDAWVKDLFELLKYPNVYADVSDFSFILGRAGIDSKPDAERFWNTLKSRLDDKSRTKVLYGSDWNMLGLLPGDEQFFSTMASDMPRNAGISPANFMCSNAIRFLGLKRGNQPRQRLETWYSTRKVKANILELIDAA